MDFVPSDSLLNGVASVVNNHMHSMLGQTHSTIHMPYVFDKIVFQVKANIENARSIEEGYIKDVVATDIIKTVNSIYKERLRYANDQKFLSRPFDDTPHSFTEASLPLPRFFEGNGRIKTTRSTKLPDRSTLEDLLK